MLRKRLYIIILTVLFYSAVGSAQGNQTYIVQPGDNLFRIALNNNVSLNELATLNNIADPTLIFVGQILILPDNAGSPNLAPVASNETVLVSNNNQDDNWCYPGQPWGDGRCDNPDPSIQAYNWREGWCAAAVARGEYLDQYSCNGTERPDPYPDNNRTEQKCILKKDRFKGVSATSGAGTTVGSFTANDCEPGTITNLTNFQGDNVLFAILDLGTGDTTVVCDTADSSFNLSFDYETTNGQKHVKIGGTCNP